MSVTYDSILSELSLSIKEGLSEFSAKLTPNSGKVLGVSVKDIRTIAKAHKTDYQAILELEENDILEISLLKCITLGLAPLTIEEKCGYIELLAQGFKNWQQTDILASSLKLKRGEEEMLFLTAERLALKDGEFEARQGLVLILARLVEKERLQKIFELLDKVKYGKYYIDMAASWLISVLYVKFPELTREYLFGDNKLNKFTYDKAIQKTIESLRISASEKVYLRMKRKG